MSKFKSLQSKSLFALLDNKKSSISHEEQVEVKAILANRELRRQRAEAAIEAANVDSLLRQNDLDWEIELYPLAVVTGYDVKGEFEDTEPDTVLGIHETLHWPIRMDIKKLLGRFACSENKPIVQNREMIELGIRLANSDNSELTFVRAIDEGASIMLAIKAGDTIKVGPDTVQRYIYLLDNRTGEHGLRIGFGETNLRCANQMNFVNNTAAHKIRHTKNMQEKLAVIIEMYDALAEEIQSHQKFMEELTQVEYDDKKFDNIVFYFIAAVTGVDLQSDYANQRTPAGWDIAVTLSDCIYEEQEAIGNTQWTLLNGVTRLTTHNREVLYPRSEMKSLEEGLAYGKEGDLLSKAYEVLMTLTH